MSWRILVVDDDAMMREGAQIVLARHFDVAAFGSPVEALDFARTWRPDLAVVDVRMPEMDGFELLARLKEDVPDVDVILMTGSVGEADRKLVRAIRQEAFYFLLKPFDREVLLTLVQRCLDLRRLEQENRRYTQRMERELGHARAFQRSLLPAERAVCGDLAIEARCRAVDELGGDLYDYTGCGPDGAAFLVADVSNHGASAAMLTGMIKSAFHTCEEADFEPRTVVARIAQTLATFHTDHFVTVFAGRARRGELQYASAGHPEQFVWVDGREPEALAANGTAIHVDLPRKQKVGRVAFPAGSRLLLYTDGVTEVRGESGRFGADRLLDVVRRVPRGGKALLDAVLDGVREFAAGRPLADDLTLMTIACD